MQYLQGLCRLLGKVKVGTLLEGFRVREGCLTELLTEIFVGVRFLCALLVAYQNKTKKLLVA